MDYKDYCEQIYQSWLSDPKHFSTFDSDFNMFSLPEPYYPLSKGDNSLVVLNNNPGGALNFQYHTYILKQFGADSSYKEVASWLMEKYTAKDSAIGGSANARNKKIAKIANAMGYDSVENVETFFLHSGSFNKPRFLKNYVKHAAVVEYKESLKSYLADRSVVIVAAVGTGSSLSISGLRSSPWLEYQVDIAGLDFSQSSLEPLTTKNGKVTSGIVRNQNKILICSMGSNNIPVRAADVIAGNSA